MSNNVETKKNPVENTKTEEPKVENKVRTRAPNKTKEEKLAIVDSKIKYHENHYKSLEKQRAEAVAEFDRKMKEAVNQLDKLRKEHKAIEEKPERLSKAQKKAELRAKMERGEKLTLDDMNFLLS